MVFQFNSVIGCFDILQVSFTPLANLRLDINIVRVEKFNFKTICDAKKRKSQFPQAHVKFNFGPRFKYAPTGAPRFKPMAERARELEIEQSVADMSYFTDKGGLKIENYPVI